MCSPVGIRKVLAIAAIKKWKVTKSDVKAAFLKSGPAQRDVYVRPPRESKDKIHYWLFLVETNGLVNFNTKFQEQSHDIILNLGLQHLDVDPKQFYLGKIRN